MIKGYYWVIQNNPPNGRCCFKELYPNIELGRRKAKQALEWWKEYHPKERYVLLKVKLLEE